MPLHVVFVDLTKAVDYMNQEALFTILKKVGSPPILLDLIKSFHENMRASAQVDGMISEPFPIVHGVKQGCVLAPTLFGIYFNIVILREAKQNVNLTNPGVGLRTRFDANLFSTSRLKDKTKTTTFHVCEALYSDDAAFCSHSEEHLQSIIDSFSNTSSACGLKISVKKTIIMSHGTQASLDIAVGPRPLQESTNPKVWNAFFDNVVELARRFKIEASKARNVGREALSVRTCPLV